MIARLRGRIVHKDASGVVVDCGGVGYGVSMSLTALMAIKGTEVEVDLLVHTHVAQDTLRLYGFLDAAERDCFAILLAAPGVGPRLALAVLSTVSPGELSEVVAQGDKAALTRIPGVGNKKAERLLLELKGRFRSLAWTKAGQGSAATAMLPDLVSALVNLGFARDVADQAARKAAETHPEEADLASLVRTALRATTGASSS